MDSICFRSIGIFRNVGPRAGCSAGAARRMGRYLDVLCSSAAPPAAGPPATATLAVATTAALALVRGRLALLPCDLLGLPHGIDQRVGDAAVLDLAGE